MITVQLTSAKPNRVIRVDPIFQSEEPFSQYIIDDGSYHVALNVSDAILEECPERFVELLDLRMDQFIAHQTAKKPDADLGWKILNEYADSIVDNSDANVFTSYARPLEIRFTRGQISEIDYRNELFRMRSHYTWQQKQGPSSIVV